MNKPTTTPKLAALILRDLSTVKPAEVKALAKDIKTLNSGRK